MRHWYRGKIADLWQEAGVLSGPPLPCPQDAEQPRTALVREVSDTRCSLGGKSWIPNTELHQFRKILAHSLGWGQDTFAFASNWSSCLSLGYPQRAGGPCWVSSRQLPHPHNPGQYTELPVTDCFVSTWHAINKGDTNYLCHSFWRRRRCMKSMVRAIHQGLRGGRGFVTVTGS